MTQTPPAPPASESPQENVTRRIIRHEPSLGYYIVAEPREHAVSYRMYTDKDVVGAIGTIALAQGPSVERDLALVRLFENRTPEINGYVKWDHCSNWNFSTPETSLAHGCCREDLVNMGLVMALCWDWAKELCPRWMK